MERSMPGTQQVMRTDQTEWRREGEEWRIGSSEKVVTRWHQTAAVLHSRLISSLQNCFSATLLLSCSSLCPLLLHPLSSAGLWCCEMICTWQQRSDLFYTPQGVKSTLRLPYGFWLRAGHEVLNNLWAVVVSMWQKFDLQEGNCRWRFSNKYFFGVSNLSSLFLSDATSHSHRLLGWAWVEPLLGQQGQVKLQSYFWTSI